MMFGCMVFGGIVCMSIDSFVRVTIIVLVGYGIRYINMVRIGLVIAVVVVRVFSFVYDVVTVVSFTESVGEVIVLVHSYSDGVGILAIKHGYVCSSFES